jgi:hypothetical protein
VTDGAGGTGAEIRSDAFESLCRRNAASANAAAAANVVRVMIRIDLKRLIPSDRQARRRTTMRRRERACYDEEDPGSNSFVGQRSVGDHDVHGVENRARWDRIDQRQPDGEGFPRTKRWSGSSRGIAAS